jgi:hypothetical protein
LIPLWIELALAGFVVLYFIGWAILVLCGNDVLAPDGRKNSAMAAIFVSIAYVAVVIFMVRSKMQYIIISTVSFSILCLFVSLINCLTGAACWTS